ncbi:glutamate--cysteine ligase [Legionella yabuuchiae]|uniref:glutamate--cysteine ligase n=1 Tax=Legionella yabuuchiae TaxID=376727 RepID=UPI001054E3D0|nr:glutamate--cysteine ligase [Legionella yabuuchiae]
MIPVPNLTTIQSGPLHHVEEVILNHVAAIEAWFRKQWQITPPPVTSSVDLRHGGFKLAPVDTNLFPAGFNNLNLDFLPLCIQAVQSVLMDKMPGCTKILIIPESHTRNKFYLKSLVILRDIFLKAGFVVRIGSLNPEITTKTDVKTIDGETVVIEPIQRNKNRLYIDDFNPCLILLNNDLSSAVPELLLGIEQPIYPSLKMGWSMRLKSDHFHFFSEVAEEFGKHINLDPWLISPLFTSVDGIDFMAKEGLEAMARATDKLLTQIQEKYETYGVEQKPFVAIKADNGTYGMSVMMVRDGQEVLELNRKQRTKMAASKGGRKVDRVIIQEGVYTYETMPNGAVAEPVVYMIGQFVVGGFYRVHQGRGQSENLNAPGMHFEPLAFATACNTPSTELDVVDSTNRFYAYGVIARLAALAAARESV